jgi:hypothetical protein
MTAQRRDLVTYSGSLYQPTNQFMYNIRNIPYLDSHKDKIAVTDVDCIIRNYGNNRFMVIEDKCYMAEPTVSEMRLMEQLYPLYCASKDFVGMFLLQHTTDNTKHNKISFWKNKQWNVFTSASCEILRSEDVFRFISYVMKNESFVPSSGSLRDLK